MIIAKFTIPGRFPSLNEYSGAERANKYGGNALKSEMSARTVKAIEEAGLRPFAGPVDFLFVWYEADGRRDWDNVTWAKKGILDGLQAAKIIPRDSRKYVPEPPLDLGYTDREAPRIDVYVMNYKRARRLQRWGVALVSHFGFNPFDLI